MSYTKSIIYLNILNILSGCSYHSVGNNSNVNVVNGITVNPQSDQFPSVQKITTPGFACTGTFISHSTMLTAAHCLPRNAARSIVSANANGLSAGDMSYNGIPSLQVFFNSSYSLAVNNGVNNLDLAVVVFPPNTAPAVSAIGSTPAQVNDNFTIVGYGDNDMWAIPSTGAGPKRFGSNSVASISGGMINFNGLVVDNIPAATGTNVSNGSGDSGGPLFINGYLLGITSGGSVDRVNRSRSSLNVDLLSVDSRALLIRAANEGMRMRAANEVSAIEGALIPGYPNQQQYDLAVEAGITLQAHSIITTMLIMN